MRDGNAAVEIMVLPGDVELGRRSDRGLVWDFETGEIKCSFCGRSFGRLVLQRSGTYYLDRGDGNPDQYRRGVCGGCGGVRVFDAKVVRLWRLMAKPPT